MEFSKHGSGTTSVKVHHAPGGKSNFSLAWDEPTKPAQQPQQPQQPQQQFKKQQQEVTMKPNQPVPKLNPAEQPAAGKTSVKVHNPPGGKSSITFG
jgi:hypothetical protein